MTREVVLYTRKQCGLCDETAAELRRLRTDLQFDLREVDIDADEALRTEYNDIIPVVAVADRVIAHAPIDPLALRADLLAALG